MEPLRIFDEPNEVEQQLGALGLGRAILETAVRRGHLARLECTDYHPATSAGFYAWSETVRTLRESLGPLGWLPSNEANQGLVIHEGRRLKLAVAGGDESTGIRDRIPSTRSTKGPRMTAAVSVNGWLFAEMEPVALATSDGMSLWLLLVYWNEQRRRIQIELSKPIGMGENDRPTEWSERIIFPHIDGDLPAGAGEAIGSPSSTTPEIRIEIKRRA
jgi:hypothetical protein